MDSWRPVDRFAPLSSLLNVYFITALSVSVIYSSVNVLSWYVYAAAILTYLIFIILFGLRNRLILISVLDYILISVILFGKSINEPLNSFFLLFPLITTALYTGHYKLLVINIIFSVAVALFIGGLTAMSAVAIPVVILGLLCYIFEWRKKWMALGEELYKHIDGYFSNEDTLHHPHEIYQPIIQDLNRIVGTQQFVEISAYVLKHNNYFLINSSEFKWERQLAIGEIEQRILLEKNFFKRKGITSSEFGGSLGFYDLMYHNKLDETEYIIVYTYFGSSKMLLYLHSGLKNLLAGVSGRIANLLYLTFRMKSLRIQDFEKFQANKDTIDEAIGTMHFIRNKLSSLGNLLEYLKLPEVERKGIPEPMVRKNLNCAVRDFQDISKHANRQLSSSFGNIPESELSNISIKLVFIMVSEMIEDHLGISIISNRNVPENAVVNDCSIYDLRVLFTDIISNMERHGTYPEARLSAERDEVTFEFINGWKKNSNKDVISVLNDGKIKSRITRKKTHGIGSIKEIAGKYGFGIKAQEMIPEGEAEARLYIKIIIPIKNDGKENSNN